MASTVESLASARFREPAGGSSRKGCSARSRQAEALEKASELGRTFTSHLVRENLIDPASFAHVAADEFGLPLLDLNAVDLRNAPG